MAQGAVGEVARTVWLSASVAPSLIGVAAIGQWQARAAPVDPLQCL